MAEPSEPFMIRAKRAIREAHKAGLHVHAILLNDDDLRERWDEDFFDVFGDQDPNDNAFPSDLGTFFGISAKRAESCLLVSRDKIAADPIFI